MTLTAEQIKEIESKQSPYGCGAWDCVSCYPLEYSCGYCEEELSTPILNGQQVYCDSCGSNMNESWQPNDEQLAFYAKHGQTATGQVVPQKGDSETLDTANA